MQLFADMMLRARAPGFSPTIARHRRLASAKPPRFLTTAGITLPGIGSWHLPSSIAYRHRV
jgi:hypothetical protein